VAVSTEVRLSGRAVDVEFGTDEAAEYRDALLAIWMRQQGKTVSSICGELKRTRQWGTRVCQGSLELLPRPHEVPVWLASFEASLALDGIEPFRPAHIHKKYLQGALNLQDDNNKIQGLMTELINKARRRTAHKKPANGTPGDECMFTDGSVNVKLLDVVLDSMRSDFGIGDAPQSVVCRYFRDGTHCLESGVEPSWKASLFLGASRVLLLGNQPIVLCEGNVIVHGSQSQVLPAMDKADGHVWISISWNPGRIKAPEANVVACANELMAYISDLGCRQRGREKWRPLGNTVGIQMPIDGYLRLFLDEQYTFQR